MDFINKLTAGHEALTNLLNEARTKMAPWMDRNGVRNEMRELVVQSMVYAELIAKQAIPDVTVSVMGLRHGVFMYDTLNFCQTQPVSDGTDYVFFRVAAHYQQLAEEVFESMPKEIKQAIEDDEHYIQRLFQTHLRLTHGQDVVELTIAKQWYLLGAVHYLRMNGYTPAHFDVYLPQDGREDKMANKVMRYVFTNEHAAYKTIYLEWDQSVVL